MAKRPNRYTEARLYMAGGSVGVLLIVWSVLAMNDRGSSTEAADTTGTTELVSAFATGAPTAVPTAAAAISSSGSNGRTQATAKPTVSPAPTAAPTAVPQTRSRGS